MSVRVCHESVWAHCWRAIYQFISSGLILHKVGKLRMSLEGKAMLLCFLIYLKHTVVERSSAGPGATGEMRSGDILGVKVMG